MKYRLIVIANLGFIIGILLGLYFKVSIILFLSIFVVGVAFWLYNKYVLEKKSKLQKKRVGILKKLYPAMGEVLAQNITGKCRGMYRVSRGYDNKPVLYAVYDTTLYLCSRLRYPPY